MGYPKDVLTDNERVVVHKHPHIKALLGPGLLLVLVTALGGWAGIWFSGDSGDAGRTTAAIAAGLVWLVVLVWFLAKLVSWRTTHFVITDGA